MMLGVGRSASKHSSKALMKSAASLKELNDVWINIPDDLKQPGSDLFNLKNELKEKLS